MTKNPNKHFNYTIANKGDILFPFWWMKKIYNNIYIWIRK